MIDETSCDAGFLDGVFAFLQSEKFRSDGISNVGLIIDGMSIRSGICVDQKENSLRGNVDYGNAAHLVDAPCGEKKAKEMLAFQIVSYSTKFKVPIAHFFINGATAIVQRKLIEEAIKKLYAVGVIVRSITCDGTTTNISTLEMLGCNFDLNDDKKPITHFKHPCNNSNIYAIMDPCHMLKLCRNTLFSKIIISPVGSVSFEYVRNLHNHQEEIGLKYANRLSSVHIGFHNKKMKVSLATQTISSGVADAIDFLRNSNNSNFKGSEATTHFLRIFDRLFDMMNSRSAYGTGFKSPLTLRNKSHWLAVFNDSEKYIRLLKIDNKPITQTRNRTFALGFIIDIHSFQGLV